MKAYQIKYLLCILVIASIGCKTVVNKLAFHPDTTNTILPEQLPENVQEIYITTEDGLKIQSYLIPDKSSKKIVVYYHGNAGNISHRLSDLSQIRQFGINVLGVGYRGYGKSNGSPSEEGIYLDGKSALEYATNDLGFNMENVYIFGRSIGTTVAVNTAQNKSIAGLILVAPLTSGNDQAKATGLRFISFMAGDSFNNIGKVKNLTSPVLIIHGSKDRVIPYEMGVEIYNEFKTEKKLVTIDGAGHNNISSHFKNEYWKPIFKFIKK
jgi:uncharacterized protein